MTGRARASEAAAPGPEAGRGLRALVMTGGLYLVIREAIGMVVRLGGVVVVTRLLGPSDYGIYFGAASVVAVVATASQLGSEIWLVRQRDVPTDELMNEVWTTLLVVSGGVTALALALSVPAALVVHGHGSITAFRLLVLSVPVNVLWAPAQARIERNFAYRKMAWLELGGDLVLYGVSVPLAVAGLGEFSLVIGYIAWQAFLLIGSLLAARFRPRLRWNRTVTKELLRHGVGYSSNAWCQRLGAVSLTVVVGAVAGSTGIGLVSLAARLVDTVAFGLRATWRLGMAALSRIADDRPKLRQTLEEGMFAQSVVLGVPMLALAVVSRRILPLTFGRAWGPAVGLYGVLCVARLVASPAQLQVTLLYSQGRTGDVTRASALTAVILWVAAVPLVFAFGTTGYAVAVVVSSAGWLVVDRSTRRIVPFSYRTTLVCLGAFAPGMLFAVAPSPARYLLLSPLLVLVVVGDVRRQLAGFARVVLGAFGRRYARPATSPSAHAVRDGDPPSGGAAVTQPRRVRSPRFAAVRRRGPAFVAVVVLLCAATFALVRHSAATYTATAYAEVNSGAGRAGPGDASDAQTLAASYASLIPKDDGIIKEVAVDTGQTTGSVRTAISVYAANLTAELVLTYQASNPGLAIRGATALAQSVSAAGPAPSPIPSGSISIASLPTTAPATSGAHRILAIGFLGALLVGLAASLGWERRDPRIDGEADLAEVLGVPVTTLPELAGGGARAFGERWAAASRDPHHRVQLTAADAALDPEVEKLAGLLAAAGAPRSVRPMAAPSAGSMPQATGGLVVLVVPQGARARPVVAAAGRLEVFGLAPAWALLVGPDFAVRGPDPAAWRDSGGARRRSQEGALPADGGDPESGPSTPAAGAPVSTHPPGDGPFDDVLPTVALDRLFPSPSDPIGGSAAGTRPGASSP